jgi:hypothetical protein
VDRTPLTALDDGAIYDIAQHLDRHRDANTPSARVLASAV